MIRKFFALLLALTAWFASTAGRAEQTDVRVALLKGPTGMGAAPLMHENETQRTENTYAFSIQGAPDAILAQLITGEADIAALPTNMIALLYQRTRGDVRLLAVNTLDVLYLLERGDTVRTPSDLAGREIIAAARGTTVEAVAERLFPYAAVEYASEHAEALVRAQSGAYDLALLPEPFVTQLCAADPSFRIALNIAEAWEASGAGLLAMSGIAVRNAFLEAHPDAVKTFLKEYGASIAYANANPEEAAGWIEHFDIMPAAVAEQSIPRVNMGLLTADAAREALDAYYLALFDVNAELIGSTLPDDSFYAAP
ncbi:MAG: ABC transporter substrate-binding protein [Clostridia bacterium]|nr:ABC transporter substrate-binding protein [Clostridia bacterium]